jgi:hypothetical protein
MSPIEGCTGLDGAEPQTWGTGLMYDILYVRLDVHKATIGVAFAEGARGGVGSHEQAASSGCC